MLLIRKAVVADVPLIYDLLKDFAAQNLLLPRSLSELYDFIRDFFVACPEDRPGFLAGACALHICWADLGEIRSLSVAAEFQGSDLGRRLYAACEEDARRLGLNRLFVLTYIPDYFKKLGFGLTEKNRFPQKIWADCLKCVNFPECGEIAMEKNL
ncbi:MAG: N-acetyltransferase [Thermodesulfobacteriota bacterium]